MRKLFTFSSADSGIGRYLVLSLVALAAVLFALLQKGMGLWALLPVLVGLWGITMRHGGLLMPLTIIWSLERESFYPTSSFDVSDVVLSGAILLYVASQYRLQSLTQRIFPADPRRLASADTSKWKFWHIFSSRKAADQKRTGKTVTDPEIGLLVLSLPVFALLAQLIWSQLSVTGTGPELPPQVWRAIILSWLIGLGFYVSAGLVNYLHRRQMTPAEAGLFLQDLLWKETRKEQRRINRWSAWARLRRKRNEDKA